MDNVDRDNSSKDQTIYILDGGMGHMIKRLGVNLKGAQKGSIERFYNITMTNLMNPEIVQNAHLEFLKAGCNIITTNNYAAIPKCLRFKHPSNLAIDVGKLASKDSTETTQSINSILQETGFFENGDVNHKNKDAVELWKNVIVASAESANVAKQQFLRTCNVDKNSGYITTPTQNIQIAGCLPPLAESYRSDLVGPFRNNLLQYRVIVTSLLDYVDLFLCETMSTIAETKSAIEAAVGVMRDVGSSASKPIWISWTLDDKYVGKEPVLRGGESIKDGVNSILAHLTPNGLVEGILFNCSSPEVITAAMPVLRNEISSLETNVRIGAYSNGFINIFEEKSEPPISTKPKISNEMTKTKNASNSSSEYRHDLTPKEYFDEHVSKWIENDQASIVGGCCGIFPEHIQYMSSNLSNL